MRSLVHPLLAAACVLAAVPAKAADNEFEVWLNPTFSTDVGQDTTVELETVQRFRDEPAADTYYGRLWVHHDLSDALEVSGGIQRQKERESRETRLLQQLGYRAGIFRGRTRLEQRFVDDADRTAWRLRQRVGVSVPLASGDNAWSLQANVEGFLTLRASSVGGDTGITGVRTIVGVQRDFGSVGLLLGYVRNQSIAEGEPDRVGHAPLVGLDFSF